MGLFSEENAGFLGSRVPRKKNPKKRLAWNEAIDTLLAK
jgi:hypothetical protein